MRSFFFKISRITEIVFPYGRAKLFLLFLVALVQGFLQVLGVTSIFPFLALAASPDTFVNSGFGQKLTEWFPALSTQDLLIGSGVFAILMLGASSVMLLFGEVYRARYIQGLSHWLRVRLLTRMVGNPYNYFLHHNTGELLKKASADVMTLIGGILGPLVDLMARVITVGLLLATLLYLTPLLTVCAVILLGGYYILVYRSLRKLRKTTSDGLKIANRGAMKESLQCLAGIKPVKVHGAEAHFLDRYSYHTATQARLSKWMPVLTNAPRHLIEPVVFGGIVAIVLVFLARGGELELILPSLGVMALAGYRLLPNIQLMYGAFSGISLSTHALEEVSEELGMTPSGQFLPDQSARFRQIVKPIEWKNSLILKDVCFSYQGAQKPVLNGINLTIEKNKFIGFVGETGSGKSTLIDLILGLHWPQEGSIVVDGEPLKQDQLRAWRAGIGYVPQEIFLMDDTISANIAFGVKPENVDHDRVQEVVEAAQLSRFIENELPNGLATRTGERGVRLSGGQRQRIGLARALYHKPSLLVLDEATSALDNQTEAALMQAIESLHGKMSLLVIAHRLTTIKRADSVVLLKGGKVSKQGPYEEVVQATVAEAERAASRGQADQV